MSRRYDPPPTFRLSEDVTGIFNQIPEKEPNISFPNTYSESLQWLRCNRRLQYHIDCYLKVVLTIHGPNITEEEGYQQEGLLVMVVAAWESFLKRLIAEGIDYVCQYRDSKGQTRGLKNWRKRAYNTLRNHFSPTSTKFCQIVREIFGIQLNSRSDPSAASVDTLLQTRHAVVHNTVWDDFYSFITVNSDGLQLRHISDDGNWVGQGCHLDRNIVLSAIRGQMEDAKNIDEEFRQALQNIYPSSSVV